MQIIKNNLEDTIEKLYLFPKECVCDNCGSVLEYELEDVDMGRYGCNYIVCPVCGEKNDLDEDFIKLNMDNIEFPQHFHHTCIEEGTKDVCNTEHIRDVIKEGIEFLRANPDEWSWFYETGNLHLSIWALDDEKDYSIIVTNNFYSTFIPYNDLDYKSRNVN